MMNPDPTRHLRGAEGAPRLTREEELTLARRFKATRDPRAQEALTRAHLRHVWAMARRYTRYGLPLEELVAEGNFGLVQALDKFDPERGVRFVTYASHWIRASVLNHVIQAWSLVGVGSGPLRSRVFFKLRRERRRVTNLLGPGEDAERILAQRLGLKQPTLQRMLQRLDTRDLSLDAELGDERRTRGLDSLPSDSNQEQALFDRELDLHLSRTVHAALNVLDTRERYITEHRLMADHQNELSLAEIARTLGVSRERARQLEDRAKRKLRSHIREDRTSVLPDWVGAATCP